MPQKLCNCGSNKYSWWKNDARGIPLCRVCEDCSVKKLKRYRPEVLTNPEYESYEEIDED